MVQSFYLTPDLLRGQWQRPKSWINFLIGLPCLVLLTQLAWHFASGDRILVRKVLAVHHQLPGWGPGVVKHCRYVQLHGFPGDRTPGTIASSTTHWQGATCGWRLKSAGLDIIFFVILNSCTGIKALLRRGQAASPAATLWDTWGLEMSWTTFAFERSQVSCHIRSLCVKRRCRLKRCVHEVQKYLPV